MPPAVMVPAASFTSYFDRFMVLAAMIPRMVTEAPTMPVAAAKMVDTKSTATKSAPLVRESMSCTAWKRRSIRPACSMRMPMKMKSGTAASVCSSMTFENWKVIR